MSLRGVLLDLDGTLVDTVPGITAALNLLRGQRGVRLLNPAEVAPWVSLGVEEVVARGLDATASTPETVSAFRSILGGQTVKQDALYPGADVVLERWRSRGVKLAVVTNKPEALARKVIFDLGLAHLFTAIVGGDTTAHRKPHPEPGRAALRRLDVESEPVIFVGDSNVDGETAGALSLPFFLYGRGYGASDCSGELITEKFDSYEELQKIVETRYW